MSPQMYSFLNPDILVACEAFTFDQVTDEPTLDVNGQIAAQTNSEPTPYTHINIGHRAATQSFPMDCVIDRVQLYDVPLSPEDVFELFEVTPENPQQPVVITSITRNDADEIIHIESTLEPGYKYLAQTSNELGSPQNPGNRKESPYHAL